MVGSRIRHLVSHLSGTEKETGTETLMHGWGEQPSTLYPGGRAARYQAPGLTSQASRVWVAFCVHLRDLRFFRGRVGGYLRQSA